MTDSITNKYGTEIRVGQVWTDNDPRCAGRTIRVVALEGADYAIRHAHRAVCEVLAGSPGVKPDRPRKVRIKVDRLHPTSTGYRLIEDPTEGDPE